MSRIQTQFFYILVILISTFLAFKSQIEIEENGKRRLKFRKIFFILAFLIPWIVIAFTNIGSDYKNYYYIIDRLNWNNYNKYVSEEAGMNLMFLTIRNIVNNTDITIFFIKTITMLLIYSTFYIIRDKIKIGYAVFAYLLLVYLPSFYLLTITLAASIVYLAIILRIYKNKKIIPVVLILLAAQLHNSAYIILPMYFFITLLMDNKQVKLKKIIFTVAYVSVIFLASFIFDYFSTSVQGFHYKGYGSNSYSGTGIMLIVMYVPLLIIYLYLKKYNKNNLMNNAFFAFMLTSLLFKLLSYKFTVIERMEYYILPLYSCIIPTIIFENKLDSTSKISRFSITKIFLMIILYLLFRGIIVFIERTMSTSGVGLYKMFNPFE